MWENDLQMQESLSSYTVKTFTWMFLGLLATFAVAIGGYMTGAIFYVFAIPYFHILLLIAELAVVLFLSARLQHLRPGTPVPCSSPTRS